MIESRAELEDRLSRVRLEIARGAERAGRDPQEIRLVAVSKGIPADVARWAVEAGAPDLGENYVTELAEKRRLVDGATWHYVGVLQRGTAHWAATLADVVHSLVPGPAARRLAAAAHRERKRLPCLVQVDVTGGHAGIPPEFVPSFVEEAARVPGIDITGLMTLPAEPHSAEDSRPAFRELRALRDRLADAFPEVRELSMGMSADFPVAVEEGATMVRIGTALFGERQTV